MAQRRGPVASYGAAFYTSQRDGSAESAAALTPLLMDALAPRTVLDVGCGVGAWVKAFADNGASTAHGIDGPWAREAGLAIPESDFRQYDFAAEAAPFNPHSLLERYDLLTTFEFVEHLERRYADALADFFVSKADCIIIGGAVPGQGGEHHVNEQWPSYWTELMAKRGYVACDFIRPAIWADTRIDPWYRQNSIAYFKQEAPAHVAELARKAWEASISMPLSLVHPDLFRAKCERASPKLGNVLGMAHETARNRLKAFVGATKP